MINLYALKWYKVRRVKKKLETQMYKSPDSPKNAIGIFCSSNFDFIENRRKSLTDLINSN